MCLEIGDRSDEQLPAAKHAETHQSSQNINAALQLSCVITSFNYACYIGRAIRSVLDQIDERCELIVIDNASEDESWDIIQSFGIAKAFRMDRNYGHRGACLRGFRHTCAPFVLFLDSDDELAPLALDRILGALGAGVSKVQFPLTPIDGRNNVIGPAFPRLVDGRERHALIRQMESLGFYDMPPTSGNVLCRALCELLDDVDYENVGDGISSLAAPFYGDVVSLSTPLGFYRVHGRNESQVGLRPTVQSLDRFSDHFYQRLLHLSRITKERQQTFRLLDRDDYLYCRCQAFVRQLLLRERPRFGILAILVFRLAVADLPIRRKAREIVYFLMLWALPWEQATGMLEYRSKKSFRGIFGLINTLIMQRRAAVN